MGFLANMKGQKALNLHGKDDFDGARKLYDEAYAAGMNDPRLLLAYSVLLLRQREYQLAREVLVNVQKLPNLSAEHKTQMFMNYSVACHMLGDTQRAITLLERQYNKAPNGVLFQTLGYLYVDYLDASKPYTPIAVEDDDKFFTEKKSLTRGEMIEKVLAFNEEAIAYDDEDPICLDNMAQTYYRVLNDKEKAKEWFDKAIALKPNQIDTLWFLSRYDLEAGNTAAAIEKLETAAEGRFSPLNYARPETIAEELKRLQA